MKQTIQLIGTPDEVKLLIKNEPLFSDDDKYFLIDNRKKLLDKISKLDKNERYEFNIKISSPDEKIIEDIKFITSINNLRSYAVDLFYDIFDDNINEVDEKLYSEYNWTNDNLMNFGAFKDEDGYVEYKDKPILTKEAWNKATKDYELTPDFIARAIGYLNLEVINQNPNSKTEIFDGLDIKNYILKNIEQLKQINPNFLNELVKNSTLSLKMIKQIEEINPKYIRTLLISDKYQEYLDNNIKEDIEDIQNGKSEEINLNDLGEEEKDRLEVLFDYRNSLETFCPVIGNMSGRGMVTSLIPIPSNSSFIDEVVNRFDGPEEIIINIGKNGTTQITNIHHDGTNNYYIPPMTENLFDKEFMLEYLRKEGDQEEIKEAWKIDINDNVDNINISDLFGAFKEEIYTNLDDEIEFELSDSYKEVIFGIKRFIEKDENGKEIDITYKINNDGDIIDIGEIKLDNKKFNIYLDNDYKKPINIFLKEKNTQKLSNYLTELSIIQNLLIVNKEEKLRFIDLRTETLTSEVSENKKELMKYLKPSIVRKNNRITLNPEVPIEIYKKINNRIEFKKELLTQLKTLGYSNEDYNKIKDTSSASLEWNKYINETSLNKIASIDKAIMETTEKIGFSESSGPESYYEYSNVPIYIELPNGNVLRLLTNFGEEWEFDYKSGEMDNQESFFDIVRASIIVMDEDNVKEIQLLKITPELKQNLEKYIKIDFDYEGYYYEASNKINNNKIKEILDNFNNKISNTDYPSIDRN